MANLLGFSLVLGLFKFGSVNVKGTACHFLTSPTGSVCCSFVFWRSRRMYWYVECPFGQNNKLVRKGSVDLVGVRIKENWAAVHSPLPSPE